MTAAGVAAGVENNDFETGLNSFTYGVEAQDAAGNAAWVEDVQPIQLFAGADKLNRLARHSAHGERGAPACIAVHTGQDDARQRHLFREVLRNVDRVLQLIYDLKERKRWDKQLSDHF